MLTLFLRRTSVRSSDRSCNLTTLATSFHRLNVRRTLRNRRGTAVIIGGSASDDTDATPQNEVYFSLPITCDVLTVIFSGQIVQASVCGS